MSFWNHDQADSLIPNRVTDVSPLKLFFSLKIKKNILPKEFHGVISILRAVHDLQSLFGISTLNTVVGSSAQLRIDLIGPHPSVL